MDTLLRCGIDDSNENYYHSHMGHIFDQPKLTFQGEVSGQAGNGGMACGTAPTAGGGTALLTDGSTATASKPRQVSSRELLGSAGELLILHGEREYRLRITQNGKLILTA